MNKEILIYKMNSMLKLIRTEYGLTQERMAVILGISKKSLVESEKGRRSLGWTEVVALATIFSQSHILQNEFGGELFDIILAIAFEEEREFYMPTMGGKIWWNTIMDKQGYKLQQNIVSMHFRILNPQDQRVLASFHKDVILECWKKLGLKG